MTDLMKRHPPLDPDARHLGLAQRSSLPDDLAYLRAAHPKAGWRRHANFGQLSAFWLHVHHGLRRESEDLATLVGAQQASPSETGSFQQAFVPQLNQFLQHLHAHHSIEDATYFPKFREIDPRMVRGFDLLEADHSLIDRALHTTIDKARALLAAQTGAERAAGLAALDAYGAVQDQLFTLLARHLADEEDLVIPVLLEHGERAVS